MTRKEADMIADIVCAATFSSERDREQITRDFLFRLTDADQHFDRTRFASIALRGSGPGALDRVL